MIEVLVMVVVVALLVIALGVTDRRVRATSRPRVGRGDRDAERVRAELDAR